MLKIRKPKDAQRLDVARAVYVIYREATTIDREAGQIAARRFFAALREGSAALQEYGVAFGIEALQADEALTVGVSSVVSLTEIALRCVSEWHGFCDEDGAPLPLNRESVALALCDQDIYDMIAARLLRGLHRLDAEGNASAPSRNGEPAGAQTTAEDAWPSAPPAPADSPA